MHRHLLAILALIPLLCCCKAQSGIPHTEDGHIVLDGVPQYFIGTNLWYAGRLAGSGSDADIYALRAELDALHALGVDNLRVLAAEGEDLDGIGRALDEMDRRGMKAVLFMGNAWEWSHGFADYLEKAGAGTQPRPSTEGYSAYMQAMAAFSTNKQAQQLNQDYIAGVVRRLRGHKAVFSWQICNEPRCFSDDPSVRDGFVQYIHSTAALIKSIDPLHMVSTGNEGAMGCEGDMDLCRRINDCPDVDYITIHIWPYNWGWVSGDEVADGAAVAAEKVGKYIDDHLQMAEDLGKSVVIEEFGYPRDGFSFTPGSPVSGRDIVYKTVFDALIASAARGGNLAGCNFWGWGGSVRPPHETWQEGDPYCGDPSQEAQGLNSVFNCDDSTVDLIRRSNQELFTKTH